MFMLQLKSIAGINVQLNSKDEPIWEVKTQQGVKVRMKGMANYGVVSYCAAIGQLLDEQDGELYTPAPVTASSVPTPGALAHVSARPPAMFFSPHGPSALHPASHSPSRPGPSRGPTAAPRGACASETFDSLLLSRLHRTSQWAPLEASLANAPGSHDGAAEVWDPLATDNTDDGTANRAAVGSALDTAPASAAAATAGSGCAARGFPLRLHATFANADGGPSRLSGKAAAAAPASGGALALLSTASSIATSGTGAAPTALQVTAWLKTEAVAAAGAGAAADGKGVSDVAAAAARDGGWVGVSDGDGPGHGHGHLWVPAATRRRNVQLLDLLGLPKEGSLRLNVPYTPFPEADEGRADGVGAGRCGRGSGGFAAIEAIEVVNLTSDADLCLVPSAAAGAVPPPQRPQPSRAPAALPAWMAAAVATSGTPGHGCPPVAVPSLAQVAVAHLPPSVAPPAPPSRFGSEGRNASPLRFLKRTGNLAVGGGSNRAHGYCHGRRDSELGVGGCASAAVDIEILHFPGAATCGVGGGIGGRAAAGGALPYAIEWLDDDDGILTWPAEADGFYDGGGGGGYSNSGLQEVLCGLEWDEAGRPAEPSATWAAPLRQAAAGCCQCSCCRVVSGLGGGDGFRMDGGSASLQGHRVGCLTAGGRW